MTIGLRQEPARLGSAQILHLDVAVQVTQLDRLRIMSLQASSSSKKRKHPETPEDSSRSISKKIKKDGKDKTGKRDKKGKGKGRQDDGQGEFKVVSASVSLSIPPVFSTSPMTGALEMLDSLTMRYVRFLYASNSHSTKCIRYVPALRGVMLSHANVRFLSQTAMIKNECPFAVCEIGFDATVWSPQVGMKLSKFLLDNRPPACRITYK